ncbi:putative membrane-anchored protein [Natronobacillus azotifigens]|uniref:DUF1129 family protein n=1 Tax=Natronobacillus azotifigens TaxID=472978 RepID=A0A9J6RC26_9BACI|nr:hypothetical protein [Natronobacillus azotifigens]MCZ0702910.1 hypothetical protein [Natronobacillus azotifigens]
MNKLAKELLKKNNTREKVISDDNQEIYTNMIVYLRGSDLTEYNQEVVREDMIELILDGQQRGDNIQKVMGGRYKEICDEIIEAIPKKTNKDKVMEYLGTSLNSIWILGVIALVKNLVMNFISDDAAFQFVLTVGDVLTILAIIFMANFIVWHITKTAFQSENNKKVGSFLKEWIVISVAFAIILLGNIYLKTIIVSIPLWVAAIIVMFIFVISKVINDKV